MIWSDPNCGHVRGGQPPNHPSKSWGLFRTPARPRMTRGASSTSPPELKAASGGPAYPRGGAPAAHREDRPIPVSVPRRKATARRVSSRLPEGVGGGVQVRGRGGHAPTRFPPDGSQEHGQRRCARESGDEDDRAQDASRVRPVPYRQPGRSSGGGREARPRGCGRTWRAVKKKRRRRELVTFQVARVFPPDDALAIDLLRLMAFHDDLSFIGDMMRAP